MKQLYLQLYCMRQASSYSLVPWLFLVEKEPGNIRGSKPFTLLHHHSCNFATVTELILKNQATFASPCAQVFLNGWTEKSSTKCEKTSGKMYTRLRHSGLDNHTISGFTRCLGRLFYRNTFVKGLITSCLE